jgi:flagellar motor switch protein FliM
MAIQNELTQEQIDTMVQAARKGSSTGTAEAGGAKVEPWDPRRAGQIGREQLQAIMRLHEGFARSLTDSLGAYLRVVFTATLVSAEYLTFREFMQRVPEMTYLAACSLEPMGAKGALQLDLKVALPIVDLLLGGEGKGIADTREITEIEEQIVESVTRIVCRDLAAAWQAVNLEVLFERRVDLDEAQRLISPDEKTLSLCFEITMLEVRGGLNLAVPVSVSHALLRKISADWADRKPHRRSEWRERLKQRLLECPFPLELAARDVRAHVSELSRLAPGEVLMFDSSANQPASLLVAGVEMFRALPARAGDTRAAQVTARAEPATENATEATEAKP